MRRIAIQLVDVVRAGKSWITAASTPIVVMISATLHASRATITAVITSWGLVILAAANLLFISVSAI